MAENENVPKYEVRYSGLFDFDGLYAAVIDWGKNYGYMWHEIYYKHKVPRPTGAEQQFRWDLTRKVTNYLSHKIVFIVHIWDMLEVEVDVNGIKKPLTSGRIFIKIQGTLITDWQNKFEGSKFKQKLGHFYRHFVYGKEVEAIYGDQLHYRVIDMQTILKKYFDVQTKKHVYKHYLGEH
jgi:hypothetical protein